MLSHVTPTQFFTALVAGMLIAMLAASFAHLDAAARRMVAVRRSRPRVRWTRHDE